MVLERIVPNKTQPVPEGPYSGLPLINLEKTLMILMFSEVVGQEECDHGYKKIYWNVLYPDWGNGYTDLHM